MQKKQGLEICYNIQLEVSFWDIDETAFGFSTCHKNALPAVKSRKNASLLQKLPPRSKMSQLLEGLVAQRYHHQLLHGLFLVNGKCGSAPRNGSMFIISIYRFRKWQSWGRLHFKANPYTPSENGTWKRTVPHRTVAYGWLLILQWKLWTWDFPYCSSSGGKEMYTCSLGTNRKNYL